MTIEVETGEPSPLLLVRLAMVAIVPPEFDPHQPVGTGPYRWVAGSVRGPVELVRWEQYWGEPPPAARVEIRFAETEDQVDRMVALGQADIVAAIDDASIPEGWRVEPVFRVSTTMLGLNVTRPPLDDPAIREAIDLALDRRELVKSGLADGAAEPAVSLVPAEVFGFSPTNRLFPADLDRARQLVASRGMAGRPRVHLDFDPTGAPEATVTALARSLRAIGLEIELHRQPFDALYRQIEEGEVDAFLFTWNFSTGDASEFLESIVHSRDPERALGLLNGSGYRDSQLDGWIESAAREPVETRRLELLRWSLARVANDRPYLPLFHRARLALIRDPFAIEPRPGYLVAPADIRPRR
jgi:peptide/nickel transport system substrate-binding protein